MSTSKKLSLKRSSRGKSRSVAGGKTYRKKSRRNKKNSRRYRGGVIL